MAEPKKVGRRKAPMKKVAAKIEKPNTGKEPVKIIHKADMPLMLDEAKDLAGYLSLVGMQASPQLVVIIYNTMKLYRERGQQISLADMNSLVKEVQTNPVYNPPQQQRK